MGKKIFIILSIIIFTVFLAGEEKKLETESINTKEGPLVITFIGHGSLMFQYQGKVIHVDPFSKIYDYKRLPKADLILISHHHGDHLDAPAVQLVKAEKTQIILTKKCQEVIKNGTIMANGDTKTVNNLKIEAVPAYNIIHKRDNGEPFHPKGEGNGYVIEFSDQRVYIAGDTENIPEMKKLKNIDIAFLPMNLPYTMTPQMVVKAVQSIKPKILFPYHFYFGKTGIPQLETLMKDIKGTELRVHNRMSGKE